MKATKCILGLAAVAALMSACKQDKEEAVTGNTFASVIVSTNGHLRAASQADEAGTTDESTITDGKYLSTPEIKDLTFTAQGTDMHKSQTWQTTAGPREMAIVVNKADLTLTALGDATKTTETNQTIADYTKPNKFVMTSKVFSKNIKPNIAQAAVVDANTNLVEADVERIAVKVTVKDPANKTITNVGNLSDLKFSVANGAKQSYLYLNNAGSRTMGTDLLYKDYKSFIHDKTYTRAQADAGTPPDFLVRLGDDAANTIVGGTSPYAAKAIGGSIYVFENSSTAGTGEFHYARQTYVKVYAKLTPTKVIKEDGTEGALDANTNGTFFRGFEDGKLYATAAAAKKKGNTSAYMYKEGKVVYLTPANEQRETPQGKVVNANTRRNNIYELTIDSFAGIGYNYDPNDPKDPNAPKPSKTDNPDEPEVPGDGGDDSIDKTETHMAVKVTVLKWNKVSINTTLGK